MRKLPFIIALTCSLVLPGLAARAQFFNYTSQFLPNPVTTNVAGSQYNVTDNANLTGAFAGALGTDIIPTNFVAQATSPTVASFNGPVTESITLVPTNNFGVPLAGDTPITKTFTADLDIIDLNNSATDSNMTGIGPLSPIQVYTFADGAVFDVQLTSYTGPGAPGGTGIGSLQAHVSGANAGVPQGLPEPGSLSLFVGLGVALTAFVRRRR